MQELDSQTSGLFKYTVGTDPHIHSQVHPNAPARRAVHSTCGFLFMVLIR